MQRYCNLIVIDIVIVSCKHFRAFSILSLLKKIAHFYIYRKIIYLLFSQSRTTIINKKILSIYYTTFALLLKTKLLKSLKSDNC